ncbi:Fc.00g020550.m01.CDS01 [Cosmosporella sp. VM-42]
MAEPVDIDLSSQSEPQISLPRAGAARSRATKRASLACVPCRSKHVKCDGGLPACLRCRLEEKSCYYAPSRRGIRDPSKRNMMRDEPYPVDREQSSDNTPSPNFANFEIPVQVTKALPGGWSVIKDPVAGSSSPTTYLFDLYYTYFQDTHSWLPPKKTLIRLLQDRPGELAFMATMIAYIGSVYTNAINSEPLRNKAYSMATGTLNTTVWNVQALLCMSITAFGEGSVDLCGEWFRKAVEMALDLGLQNKGFADSEENLILAESYRRTYWGLYLHGSLRTVREHHGHFQLYSTPATTELPCEEWEYQTGDIPTPISFEEYDRIGASKDYSSWAYLSALIRIAGESVVPLLNVGPDALPEAVDRADHRIVSWLLQLPKWKQELVDPHGAVDMILFHAELLTGKLRIRIQLHLNGAGVHFRAPNLLTDGPIFRESSLVPQKLQNSPHPWLYGSTAFQASLSLVGLFKFHLPPEKFSPSCIFGIERAVLPMLDAYLFGNIKTLVLKDKIVLLANVLCKAGIFWPMSKMVSDDIFRVLETAEAHDGVGCGEQQGVEQLMDEFLPPGMEQEDIYNFVQPMTTGEMNSWTGQMIGMARSEEYLV